MKKVNTGTKLFIQKNCLLLNYTLAGSNVLKKYNSRLNTLLKYFEIKKIKPLSFVKTSDIGVDALALGVSESYYKKVLSGLCKFGLANYHKKHKRYVLKSYDQCRSMMDAKGLERDFYVYRIGFKHGGKSYAECRVLFEMYVQGSMIKMKHGANKRKRLETLRRFPQMMDKIQFSLRCLDYGSKNLEGISVASAWRAVSSLEERGVIGVTRHKLQIIHQRSVRFIKQKWLEPVEGTNYKLFYTRKANEYCFL